MAQQYIYQPTSPVGLQGLYSDPDTPPGTTNLKQLILDANFISDRVAEDEIELPFKLEKIFIQPNELAQTEAINLTFDRLQQNFLYLATVCSIESNKLPLGYAGFYSAKPTAGVLNTPEFTSTEDTEITVPTTNDISTNPTSTGHTPLSSLTNGDNLNNLVDGVWTRDNSPIQAINNVSYHYGLLLSADAINIVKMSSTPDETYSWSVLNKINEVDTETNNSLEFTNLSKIKLDSHGAAYILDKGINRPGISNVSNNSTRNVIYKYDISGLTNVDNDNTIYKNKIKYLGMLGDTYTSKSAADLIEPTCFTFTTNNIVVYDEYDYAFKIFDYNFNFVKKYPKRNNFFRGFAGEKKQYIGVSDINYNESTNTFYVLTPGGRIIIYDSTFNNINEIVITNSTSNETNQPDSKDLNHPYYQPSAIGRANNEQYLSITSSTNDRNVYYVLTSFRVIKRFVSKPNFNIGSFKFLDKNIGIPAAEGKPYRFVPKFLSTFLEATVVVKQKTDEDNNIVNVLDSTRSYTYDMMYMYGDFLDIDQVANLTSNTLGIKNWKYILAFKERTKKINVQHDDDFNVYDIVPTTTLNYKEYVSSLVYNKVFHKLLSNHTKLLKSIIYKFQCKYNSTGSLLLNQLEYISQEGFNMLLPDVSINNYIGINEYVTPGTLNRCLKEIYEIQLNILKVLSPNIINTFPLESEDSPLEPYTYTPGNEYIDTNDKKYTGYYHIANIGGKDRIITGRNNIDGTTNEDMIPTPDRYLTNIDITS